MNFEEFKSKYNLEMKGLKPLERGVYTTFASCLARFFLPEFKYDRIFFTLSTDSPQIHNAIGLWLGEYLLDERETSFFAFLVALNKEYEERQKNGNLKVLKLEDGEHTFAFLLMGLGVDDNNLFISFHVK